MQVQTYIGIDPGVTGAISCIKILDGSTSIRVHKMPLDVLSIQNLLEEYLTFTSKTVTVLESVHSSPQQGVSTAFKFGRVYGWLEGILSNFPNRIAETPTPVQWQRAVDCMTGGNKALSVKRANELFKDVSGITQKTADSLLLAYYGYLKHGR